jgi:uroporphyrinogen decarboxylase
MGVDILNPVQTSVEGLQDTSALKEAWGDRLCFHGAIDVQQMLPNAIAEELEAEVALRVRDLGRDGGYILAPCHNVGHDIPPGNIVTLFETARRLGSDPGAADRILENSKPYFELHGVKQ